jgi:mannose-6-phosphate isomerase-like protein (cupin superfamily)
VAQERKVDPTWLHRYVPDLREKPADMTAAGCHYVPIFGEGDSETHVLQTFARFGEATIDPHGSCRPVSYPRQEALYFVLEGGGTIGYSGRKQDLKANDFTYVAPGVRNELSNGSEQPMRVVVIGLKIPPQVEIGAAPASLQVGNLADAKEQTVQGHPSSVLYKLLIGPRTGTRDIINAAYVEKDLFLMDFAPGGTNFPHHHQLGEEIYLLLDGQGDMVAGGGMDGVEGRHPAKPGDAYYFRPNCTVGFYNQNVGGAKAHILAVRDIVPVEMHSAD